MRITREKRCNSTEEFAITHIFEPTLTPPNRHPIHHCFTTITTTNTIIPKNGHGPAQKNGHDPTQYPHSTTNQPAPTSTLPKRLQKKVMVELVFHSRKNELPLHYRSATAPSPHHRTKVHHLGQHHYRATIPHPKESERKERKVRMTRLVDKEEKQRGTLPRNLHVNQKVSLRHRGNNDECVDYFILLRDFYCKISYIVLTDVGIIRNYQQSRTI